MTKLSHTVTEVSIHPEGSNPVLDEMVTRVTLSDEGGGEFVTISQNQEGTGGVRLDLDEVIKVMCIAFSMLDKTKEEPEND